MKKIHFSHDKHKKKSKTPGDQMMLNFLESTKRNLIWMGDLNIAREFDDVGPSPKWFRKQHSKYDPLAEKPQDDFYVGHPGFTVAEQVYNFLCLNLT